MIVKKSKIVLHDIKNYVNATKYNYNLVNFSSMRLEIGNKVY